MSDLGDVKERGQSLASTLPPLLVRAERVAANVAPGLHGRQRSGRGETFWEFRHYQPSDNARSIDWRRSARSESLFVRENEWETSQTTWLWNDRSPSMDYRSDHKRGETKAVRAAVLIVALAALLVRGGERVGLLGMNRRARWGAGGLVRLVEAMEDDAASAGGGIDALPCPERLSTVVLASDFLMPLDRLDGAVRTMAGQGVRGHLLRLYDPAEETLPFAGRVRFVGTEGEDDLLITRAEEIRHDYRERFRLHGEAVAAIARDAGWTQSVHRTDMPPETALLALFCALSQDGGRKGLRR